MKTVGTRRNVRTQIEGLLENVGEPMSREAIIEAINSRQYKPYFPAYLDQTLGVLTRRGRIKRVGVSIYAHP